MVVELLRKSGKNGSGIPGKMRHFDRWLGHLLMNDIRWQRQSCETLNPYASQI